MKNICLPPSRSKFPVKLIYCTAFASCFCCFRKFTAINLYSYLVYRICNDQRLEICKN